MSEESTMFSARPQGMASTVLVADAEPGAHRLLYERLATEGCQMRQAATAAAAIAGLGNRPDLVMLDAHLPDTGGLAVLRQIRAMHVDLPVIMLSARASVETAVEAVKCGAFDYFPKDGDLERVVRAASLALQASIQRRQALRSGAPRAGAVPLIGESAAMRELKRLARRVAASGASTILITGETGTGKDLLAQTLHALSDRAARPFVTITCSALPDHLLESELFGYERGAFTDARQQKRGLIESADRGTLFLDEIGEMTLPLQAKLLRVLEEKSFKRVGALHDVRVDVRVVAATHRDLAQRVRLGQFREDLFCRLNVVPIRVPALRERRDDVPLLAQHFVDRFSRELGTGVGTLAPDALAALDAYDWPGNVRELRNVIERAALLATKPWLTAADLGLPRMPAGAGAFILPPDGVEIETVERDLLAQALARVGGNQARAAGLLGLNRDQVRYRMRKFGLAGRLRGRAAAAAA